MDCRGADARREPACANEFDFEGRAVRQADWACAVRVQDDAGVFERYRCAARSTRILLDVVLPEIVTAAWSWMTNTPPSSSSS
jgi:hypothetical protein